MEFIFNDGGRKAAGLKGKAGDCVCRSIAIITGRSYSEVYEVLARGNATQRKGKARHRYAGIETADHGIYIKRKWCQDYLKSLGLRWVPTMEIGRGCKVHLRKDELPSGRLLVQVSRHMTAVIDGVLHDTHDCTRGGTRCVYGYWIMD